MNASITMVVANNFALIQLEVSSACANQDTMVVFSVPVSNVFLKFLLFYYSDINECNSNISGCSQECFNTVGSYYCGCDDGYLLGSDNHTCTGNSTTEKL